MINNYGNYNSNIESGMPGNKYKIVASTLAFFATIMFVVGIITPYHLISFSICAFLALSSVACKLYGMIKNNKENKKIRELNNNFIAKQTEYIDDLHKANEEWRKKNNGIHQPNEINETNYSNRNVRNSNNDLLTPNNNIGNERT